MSFAYTTDGKERLSEIQTPDFVAKFLFDILRKRVKPAFVLDPACGIGNLLLPWHDAKIQTLGIEIKEAHAKEAKIRGLNVEVCAFENWWPVIEYPVPDLVVCNAPWSRHWSKSVAYPEVFLRRIVQLWGPEIPIAFPCPMGFRLNQEFTSKRWRWLSGPSAPQITSIISAPKSMYQDTAFHSEILIFNVKGLKAHYWCPSK